jgi:hypothetical protein
LSQLNGPSDVICIVLHGAVGAEVIEARQGYQEQNWYFGCVPHMPTDRANGVPAAKPVGFRWSFLTRSSSVELGRSTF